jgi:hypothetical protein
MPIEERGCERRRRQQPDQSVALILFAAPAQEIDIVIVNSQRSLTKNTTRLSSFGLPPLTYQLRVLIRSEGGYSPHKVCQSDKNKQSCKH